RDQLRSSWGQPLTPELIAQRRRLAELIDVKAQAPATLVTLAITLEVSQLPGSAIQVLQAGQYAYPADFWLNFHLADHLYRRKDYAGAIRYFSIVVSIRPGSATAHNNLGTALHEEKKPDEAFACYRKAVELDPKFALAHNNIGNVLHAQKKPDAAIACYR